MESKDSNFVVRLNKEKKQKASEYLKNKGDNLSTYVRKIIYELAEEYNKK